MTSSALQARTALALVFVSLTMGLTACSRPETAATATTPAPWVRMVAIEDATVGTQMLSGTVKARLESPVAFQIGGRVLTRHVEAGQAVRTGQLLFSLDPRDVAASEQAASAQLAAAEAAMETARRELERQRRLVEQGYVSAQTLDRLELGLRDTLSRLDAARAQATQTRNARGYADLRAPRDGVITEVSGEAGQVVSAGQGLAVLAQAGEREVEVHLPSATAPRMGSVTNLQGATAEVQLREVAGAADAQSRTWRARYRIEGPVMAEAWPLGTVVRLNLNPATTDSTHVGQRVPLAALDERSDGPRMWRVVNGQAEPVAVEVLALDASHARIRSPLATGERVVALGTHRLTPGMAVRELAP